MWYEIIPSALVVMAGVGLPQYACAYIHNLVYNRPLARLLLDPVSRRLYLRDERLTDNPWTAGDEGLKSIPDD